ncbi:MAG TPA: hypothetical protein VN704_11510 [Verrucomicrobiae bacterium]|nr:hypothetical protein [Verrucomicrobiae bacterium]
MSQLEQVLIPMPPSSTLLNINNQDQFNNLYNIIYSITKNDTEEDILNSLNKYYLKAHEQLKELIHNQLEHNKKSDEIYVKQVVENDYSSYKMLKFIFNIGTNSIELREKFSELTENLFDYENVMTGIYLYKPEKFDEKIKDMDIKDLQKNIYISFLILLSLFFLNPKQDFKTKIFLRIGIQSSQILQSYADTLDILVNEQLT